MMFPMPIGIISIGAMMSWLINNQDSGEEIGKHTVVGEIK